ncbi:Uncharacterised protein [[Actinobacillus] rossii]|uniref:Uncharacterized protein n=1 Tax=[Actinobacillus] rossii TaxID=123820 RepID=A0A380TXV3_9PAST|nr:Uncharacterised protein [[Actinobacillus] rossii]
MEENQEHSLTCEDKEQIKYAVLKAVENGCTEPEILLTKILSTFERIDRYGNVVKGESLKSSDQ